MRTILILFFIMIPLSLKAQTVSILYFNDAHRMMPLNDRYGNRGGMSRLKTVIDSVKADNPFTLVIFGGDLAGGTLFGGIYKGHPMIEAMNLLPVDVANFGQHDFDFGLENASQLTQKSNFQWITANIGEDYKNRVFSLPAYIMKRAAGLKIAFFGLTDALETSSMEVHSLQLDYLEAAERTLKDIRKEEPDIIIAVTQMSRNKNKTMMRKFPEIDAVLTEEQAEDESHIVFLNDRPLCSSAGNISSLVRLDILPGGKTRIQVYAIDSTVRRNAELLALEEQYNREIDSLLGEKIIPLKEALSNRSRFPSELFLGNLVTDAYRHYYDCDAAFMHTGGLRSSLSEGMITVKDIHSVLPFGNIIMPVMMKGSMIKNFLEHGAADLEHKAQRLLQVSGISYTIDSQKPAYERIVNISMNGIPLEKEREYCVAVPDYLLHGGDDFPFFTFPDSRERKVFGRSSAVDAEIVMSYLKDGKLLADDRKGRILFLNSKQ